ncbi:homocysteine S-methyltransferase [Thalassotalea sp. Y01]|uniref:homocysteine S-methyltransferase n=1 Tax=Thalassotalea sp. Y01 TaxID=2729613 RepID=UPI00145D0AC3|nr:homocysteine S-methyltransferase [Thalassotalea sp. Y01]NMP15611.1 homocysteine S-methyltransferase [Thalassotalea sp. Y01]
MTKPLLKDHRIIEFLNQGNTLLLDGGMSNQLEEQGFDLNNSLWSAQLLLSAPTAIVAAHLHYLKSGAQCVITASYQASVAELTKLGLSENQASDLIVSSVTLAQHAVEQFMQLNPDAMRPFVAASIGPYGASLADGSEYHGNYGVSDEVLKTHHQTQMSLLTQTDADMLACETVPSLQEARVLTELLNKQTKPAWLSFSCKNGQQLNDGTPIEECVAALRDSANPIAFGVNCTNPTYMVELIERIKSVCNDKFIVVYPNSGEDYDAQSKTWHGTATPNECGLASEQWLNAGANIIGGCCRMGPKHIASIKAALTKSNAD